MTTNTIIYPNALMMRGGVDYELGASENSHPFKLPEQSRHYFFWLKGYMVEKKKAEAKIKLEERIKEMEKKKAEKKN